MNKEKELDKLKKEINEELGYVSGIFMQQEIKGTEIIMPTEELNEISDRIELYLFSFTSKIQEEATQVERKRIRKIIKEMPDTFPELESDTYDEACKDAKRYMLANT